MMHYMPVPPVTTLDTIGATGMSESVQTAPQVAA